MEVCLVSLQIALQHYHPKEYQILISAPILEEAQEKEGEEKEEAAVKETGREDGEVKKERTDERPHAASYAVELHP